MRDSVAHSAPGGCKSWRENLQEKRSETKKKKEKRGGTGERASPQTHLISPRNDGWCRLMRNALFRRSGQELIKVLLWKPQTNTRHKRQRREPTRTESRREYIRPKEDIWIHRRSGFRPCHGASGTGEGKVMGNKGGRGGGRDIRSSSDISIRQKRMALKWKHLSSVPVYPLFSVRAATVREVSI